MTRRAGLAVVAGVLAALALAGAVIVASEEDTGEAAAQGPLTYVAVGASDSVGVGADDPATQAWPVVFLGRALPERSRYVNVAVSGSTTAQALSEQLPKALAADPDVITVWLSLNDLLSSVEPALYGGQLRELVTTLRRNGETTVLVANTPEIDQLPAVASGAVPLELVEQRVDEYNRVIEEVVADTGAVLVDLHARSEAFEAAGRIAELTSSDGFHLNAEGYREVAAAFADAYDEVAQHTAQRPAGGAGP